MNAVILHIDPALRKSRILYYTRLIGAVSGM
jgi:hypothetical protein